MTGCRIPRRVTPFTWTDVVRDEPLRGVRGLSRASSGWRDPSPSALDRAARAPFFGFKPKKAELVGDFVEVGDAVAASVR